MCTIKKSPMHGNLIKILKLYTGRDFEKIEIDTNKKEKFAQKNWDHFSKEQVILEDNIMHLCVF